ncbi:tRNA 2-thiouridine(34) synthase MnmA [Salidesulfovibrio onnuriiensis]|uniref:tRNA 2-thiouridine(34) synthase MnmA n=1 Tax=Salidesulfovibrio onnuriiensis TaxID=2583823 RepID=UPI00202AF4B8|nr:tRNA 2-thiouridine(34) synthase MnmA [Salidesulfovibrio onnuriiensis]
MISGTETVAVAVSGGMDSLLALCLLREQGRDIMAVHGHLLPPGPGWDVVREGLSRNCAKLGVPFHALDLHAEFERCVVERFAADYRAGLTPNPCAVCNPEIKFGLLFDRVRELGADSMATGHYADLEERPGMGRLLVRGQDRSKDQSYFLSLVPVDRLRRAYFPLARTYKKDVMDLLGKYGLEPPLPKESQEICFIPDDDYQAFLETRGNLPGPGPIVLEDGTQVGRHKGLWRHTQGQRRGLGIAWQEPLYVLDKDVAGNALVVGPRSGLDSPGCLVRDLNFMVAPGQWPEVVQVQTRYRQQAKPSRFSVSGDRLELHFIEPHSRPTPGQVAAVYTDDGAVLGGGLIERAL